MQRRLNVVTRGVAFLCLAGIVLACAHARAADRPPASPPGGTKCDAPPAKTPPPSDLGKAFKETMARIAIESVTSNMARLIAEYKGSILSGNAPKALSENEATALSHNKAKVLSENDASLLSNNRASLFSNINVEISITVNNYSANPPPPSGPRAPARK